ncbi:MAG: peptidylprolyl isomerase [Bacteroidota bacterium]
MKKLLFLILSISSVLISQKDDDTPLVKVGPIVITKKEFVERYEMTPGINRRKNDMEGSKGEFLLSMIAEKLLILKAQQEGWDNDTIVNYAVREVERALVRDELYRKEVAQKIAMPESEIAQGMRRALNDMKVYFLFAKTKEGAEFLSTQIRNGKPLETFSFTDDSKGEFEGPDSAIARFGDVDVRMENVIYALKLNETSAPIQLDDGWYLVKLMGKTVTVVVGNKEKSAVRERVESILRKRKEQKRMTEYMNFELKSIKTDVNARLLKNTVIHLWQIAQAKEPVRTDSTTFFVDHSVIDSLRVRMNDTLQMTFVTFPHTVWTLEKALEKIVETNLATVNPNQKKFRIDFEQRLHDLVDQEYLVQTGYRQGLNQSSAVRNDLKVWRDSYLSQFVRNKAEDTVTVSQNDIEELRRIFRNDTSIVNNNSKAREKMHQMKTNNALDRVVGTTANGTEITFFEKNFKEVQVTSSPTLVYRYLGFGGRMFAVPFVIPQTGWINYWNNKNVKLP